MMVARLPFQGLHLFAAGAAESEDAAALIVPLADGQEHERAFIYVTGAQRFRLGVEAICRRSCCQAVVRLALPLVDAEPAGAVA